MVTWKVYKKHVVEKLQQELCLLKNDINNAVNFIQAIEKKDWTYKFANTQQEHLSPLIKALASLNKEISHINQTDEERNWTNNGIAAFTEIIRKDNNSMEELGYAIIQYLARYLNANQGSIYFLNDDDAEYEQYLDLRGCYAYNKKKFISNRIGSEEGLLGQCLKEGEYIYITKVPSAYVKITSGLGEATPRCIILVPLISDNKKAGVFELAFFDILQKYQIEFLLKVAEIVASFVLSAREREHTNLLLKQSEILTHQLRVNEEEMRQNLEEVTALQEEMQRQNKELEQVRRDLIAKHTEMELMQKRDAELLELKLKANNDINQTIIQRLKQKIKAMEVNGLAKKILVNN